MKVKTKRMLALCAAFAGAAVMLIITLNNREPEVPVSLGSVEAVMTTQVQVINGMSDGESYDSELYFPIGIALAGNGLLIADTMCDRIQIISDEKTIRVGKPGSNEISYASSGALIDGYLENARFKKPTAVTLSNGDAIICDTGNNALRKITDNVVLTIAGGLGEGYQNGKEGSAKFNKPSSAAVSSDGTIYVADTMNHCIRAIDRDGNVTLYAGTPQQSGFADGTLTDAMFYEPAGLCFGADGVLYVADSANHAIRKIENETVTTVAGSPGAVDPATDYPSGGLADGANATARFYFPHDLVVLPSGDIYVADTMNHCIRLISGGETRTVLGNGESGVYYASAENLKLSKPSGIDSDGRSLYISDTMNNAVVVVPISETLKAGRSLREDMLKATGVSTTTRYPYNGEIRLFVGSERVIFDKVKPWNTTDRIYIPIKPLFEALGAEFTLNQLTNDVTICMADQQTVLGLNTGYFILKGTAVMPLDEVTRLFPYTVEWFSEFNVIAVVNGG